MSFSEVFGPMKWHVLSCAAVFFVLPAFKFVVSGDALVLCFLIASVANMAVILITGMTLTIKKGFKWYYPFVVAFLYAVSLPIYYDVSMIVHIITYFTLTLTSQIIGYIIGKIIVRNR